MLSRRTFASLLVALSVTLMALSARAQVPNEIPYQGYLTDTEGTPVSDQSAALTFRLYDQPTGGTALWQEAHEHVSVTGGVFSVRLGSVEPFGSLQFDGSLYLSVAVGDETVEELAPRVPLGAVPFSFMAAQSTLARESELARLLAGSALRAGQNVTITEQTDGALEIAASGGENGGVIGDGHSLDAPDGDPVDALLVDEDGRVGIGTDSPTSPLTVAGLIESSEEGFKFPDGTVQATAAIESAAEAAWSLTGNAGTDPQGQFLGTTDGVPLEIRVGGQRVMRYEPASIDQTPNVIGGWNGNRTSENAEGVTIAGGGGRINTIDLPNVINGRFGTVGGGIGNRVDARDGTIAGGQGNTVAHEVGTIAGGGPNGAGAFSFVGGGASNQAGDLEDSSIGYATVAGGNVNRALGAYATVGGGLDNSASGPGAFVGGGGSNKAERNAAVVAGGARNEAREEFSTIAGGRNNVVSAAYSIVGGGDGNTAGGASGYTTVAGGSRNEATGYSAAIGGGSDNEAFGENATVAGGGSNKASGGYATVGGGDSNVAGGGEGGYTTVAGGYENEAATTHAVVGGGDSNIATGLASTIGGGARNHAGGDYGTASGGQNNFADGTAAVVGGGADNKVHGDYATIPGGQFNEAIANYSFAAGHFAHAHHVGAFVWSGRHEPDSGIPFTSTAENQFLINATGGVGLGTNAPLAQLHVQGEADAIIAASANGNGLEVSAESGKGILVERAGQDGVQIQSAGGNGILIDDVDGHGIFVLNAGGKAAILRGDVDVAGTLTKASGTFKIDHPLDPENKYLSHSFVESPDMMNVYNGNVVLDGRGEAWVDLPAYFEALNKDFRYQLTPIGAPGPGLYVAEKIAGNRFKIGGGTPRMEVSWHVTGIRRDPYAEQHPVEVETWKTPEERGRYLHPEAYGRPTSQ